MKRGVELLLLLGPVGEEIRFCYWGVRRSVYYGRHGEGEEGKTRQSGREMRDGTK